MMRPHAKSARDQPGQRVLRVPSDLHTRIHNAVRLILCSVSCPGIQVCEQRRYHPSMPPVVLTNLSVLMSGARRESDRISRLKENKYTVHHDSHLFTPHSSLRLFPTSIAE